MEQNNLQQIKDLVLSAVHVGNSDYPIAILPKEMNVVSLEQHNKHRNNFRAQFSTYNFDSLVSYAKANEQEGAQCFIDEKNLGAALIFDVGNRENPQHAQHRATLKMEKTAAFKALCEFQGKKCDQRTFSDWLEDWSDFITPYNENDEPMLLTAAVQAVRKITLDYATREEHEVGDFAASKSAMESVEAKSKLELPRYFLFNTHTYKGLEERGIIIRLSILTGGDAPVLIARLIKAEQMQETIAKEFADKLTDALKETEIKVNIGTIEI